MLTSSVVSCYVTYLTWDGLTNCTDSNCNDWNDAKDTGIIITAGVVIMLLTLFYISFRKRESVEEQSAIRGAAEPILARDEDGEDQVPYNEQPDNSKEMLYFHLFMIFVSF